MDCNVSTVNLVIVIIVVIMTLLPDNGLERRDGVLGPLRLLRNHALNPHILPLLPQVCHHCHHDHYHDHLIVRRKEWKNPTPSVVTTSYVQSARF